MGKPHLLMIRGTVPQVSAKSTLKLVFSMAKNIFACEDTVS